MKKLFLILIALPYIVSAQQKMLNLNDVVLKQRTSLAPTKLPGLSWVPNSNKFTYWAKKSEKDCIVMQDAVSLKRDTILTLEKYNELISKSTIDAKAVERIGNISWLDETTFRFYIKNSIYHANVSTGKVELFCFLPENAEAIDIEPKSGRVAFITNKNLAVSTLLSFKESNDSPDGAPSSKSNLLTKDGSYGNVYGVAVHRNEFGIHKGTFWSPTGKRLAYYQMNEMMVTDYPIYNLNNMPATQEMIKYPMAGTTSHVVTIHVKDFEKNRTVTLHTGLPLDQYLTNVSWGPGEEKIYVAVVNRAQNKMMLNEYDAVTGSFSKTLFTEEHEKYVEPENPMVFCKNNPKQFIWMSKRDGYNQLYLYNSNGKLDKQLTTGKFDVTEFLGFNENGSHAYYMAASEDGMDRYCYSVELASGKNTKLTLSSGVHRVLLNDAGTLLLDVFSNTTIPANTSILGTRGEEKALLVSAINPLAEYKKCEMKLFKIKAADGITDLNCRMFLPADFNANKKYPTLVYLYGGPHAQLITNSWLGNADMWLYYMAQQGYVVFSMDNRGSANRGLNFENSTFRKLGTEESADQIMGINYLKSQKYVDASRIGIYGWSFGGFMTITMMTKTNDFKAGVAGGPVTDWNMYEIMYTERYMDTPKENQEGYENANLIKNVKKLHGKLMLIHGTDDDVVLWQHSLKFVKKCVDEGIQVDYFAYPGHKHNVLGKDRVHLMQKITDYFNQNL